MKILVLFLLSQQLFGQQQVFFGIRTASMSVEKAKVLDFINGYGEYVGRVMPNSLADKAGLQPFDYIYAINGQEFSERERFYHVLKTISVGEIVSISWMRGKQEMEATIQFAWSGKQPISVRSALADPYLGVEYLAGGEKKVEIGVAVNIVDCSTASLVGMKKGDEIIKIDNIPIVDWSDLHYAIDNRKVGDQIELTIKRRGLIYHVITNIQPTVILQANCDRFVAIDNLQIAENENEIQIKMLHVFPNPNSGSFDLKLQSQSAADIKIEIFDALGRLFYQQRLKEFSNFHQERINVSNLNKGVYLLKVTQGSISEQETLIIN